MIQDREDEPDLSVKWYPVRCTAPAHQKFLEQLRQSDKPGSAGIPLALDGAEDEALRYLDHRVPVRAHIADRGGLDRLLAYDLGGRAHYSGAGRYIAGYDGSSSYARSSPYAQALLERCDHHRVCSDHDVVLDDDAVW